MFIALLYIQSLMPFLAEGLSTMVGALTHAPGSVSFPRIPCSWRSFTSAIKLLFFTERGTSGGAVLWGGTSSLVQRCSGPSRFPMLSSNTSEELARMLSMVSGVSTSVAFGETLGLAVATKAMFSHKSSSRLSDLEPDKPSGGVKSLSTILNWIQRLYSFPESVSWFPHHTGNGQA